MQGKTPGDAGGGVVGAGSTTHRLRIRAQIISQLVPPFRDADKRLGNSPALRAEASS